MRRRAFARPALAGFVLAGFVLAGFVLAGAFGLAVWGALPAGAGEGFVLPPETAVLLPGPGLETAEANCSGCHSVDYILTQPRDLPDPGAFWAAEVTKMRRFYAAPIDDAAVPEIVAYLAATYAR